MHGRRERRKRIVSDQRDRRSRVPDRLISGLLVCHALVDDLVADVQIANDLRVESEVRDGGRQLQPFGRRERILRADRRVVEVDTLHQQVNR